MALIKTLLAYLIGFKTFGGYSNLSLKNNRKKAREIYLEKTGIHGPEPLFFKFFKRFLFLNNKSTKREEVPKFLLFFMGDLLRD